MRLAVLWSAIIFTGLLLFLTGYVLVTSGPDVLTIFSIVVLGLFIFGIIGALKDGG